MEYALDIMLHAKNEKGSIFVVEVTTKETKENVAFMLDGYSMKPLGKLQRYFEVLHDYEFPDDLNARLRRQWTVASAIDELVGCYFSILGE